jgi:hypothetical protein
MTKGVPLAWGMVAFLLIAAARLLWVSLLPRGGAEGDPSGGPQSAQTSPSAFPEASPPCVPPVALAELAASSMQLAELRALREQLEPSAAGELPTVELSTLERASRAIGHPSWVDCEVSPCVVRFEGGSPRDLAAALRAQSGLEEAYVIAWSLKGAVQLAVWPTRPPEEVEAAAHQRLLSLHKRSKSP